MVRAPHVRRSFALRYRRPLLYETVLSSGHPGNGLFFLNLPAPSVRSTLRAPLCPQATRNNRPTTSSDAPLRRLRPPSTRAPRPPVRRGPSDRQGQTSPRSHTQVQPVRHSGRSQSLEGLTSLH